MLIVKLELLPLAFVGLQVLGCCRAICPLKR